jgi:hypothetical protein
MNTGRAAMPRNPVQQPAQTSQLQVNPTPQSGGINTAPTQMPSFPPMQSPNQMGGYSFNPPVPQAMPINTGPTQPPMETDTRVRGQIPSGLSGSIPYGGAVTPPGLRGLFSNYGGAGGMMSNQANRNRLFY